MAETRIVRVTNKECIFLPAHCQDPITVIKSWCQINDYDYTVEFETTRPSSFVPFQLVYVLFESPMQRDSSCVEHAGAHLFCS